MDLIRLCGTLTFLATITGAQEQPPPAPQPQPGVEVQTRGPIHEAFLEPATDRQPPSPIVPKKPPEPIPELPPEQKPEGDSVMWIPGYWAWDDDRQDFLWVSGVWRAPPPNHTWVPGYWQQADGGWQRISGYWSPIGQESVTAYPPPPDPVEEAVPPAPDANSFYVPGIWNYVEGQYRWRPGFWTGIQAGWVWSPDCYLWTPAGYVFVSGFWDHDLDNRGLAFAPVVIPPQVYAQANWVYRPSYALNLGGLLGSLFVNPRWHGYYFGDYFDPAYARRGYVPWVSYQMAGTAHSPFYSYMRWQNRNNARWEQELHNSYRARAEGSMVRPPRTLAEQERHVKAGKLPGRVVSPLNHWDGKPLKLGGVSREHVQQSQRNAEQWRALSQHRQRVEVPVKHPAPQKVHQAAPHRIEMPRVSVQHPTVNRTPPPRPAHPAPKAHPKVEHKKK